MGIVLTLNNVSRCQIKILYTLQYGYFVAISISVRSSAFSLKASYINPFMRVSTVMIASVTTSFVSASVACLAA